MITNPRINAVHKVLLKKFGQSVDIDYINTEQLAESLVKALDDYDKSVIENMYKRYEKK